MSKPSSTIKCPKCGRDVGITYLSNHMRNWHYPCPICGEPVGLLALRIHASIYHGKKP